MDNIKQRPSELEGSNLFDIQRQLILVVVLVVLLLVIGLVRWLAAGAPFGNIFGNRASEVDKVMESLKASTPPSEEDVNLVMQRLSSERVVPTEEEKSSLLQALSKK